MTKLFRNILAALGVLALAGCSGANDDAVTRIAFVGSDSDFSASGLRLSPAAQHLRAATTQGLVAINAEGEVVPALAERWIVTDDGMSYIFRLQNTQWSDGTRVTGGNVQAALLRNIRELEGTSLGLDLAIVDEIRAMTGRVIEIRLKSPMPQFLQLLSQPELGLARNKATTGPMDGEIDGNTAFLKLFEPEFASDSELDRWRTQTRQIRITSLSASDAAKAYYDGEVDALLNGHLLSLPLADTGPLARGAVRLDLVYGLFGLRITNTDGFLEDQLQREAIAMAIERETLLEGFGIGSWAPSTRLVPQPLVLEQLRQTERWANMEVDERKSRARQRVATWISNSGADGVTLTISIPEREGTALFFGELAQEFADIGITLRLAEKGQKADLELVDSLARYGDPRWFLNQFNCSLENGPCNAEADELVSQSVDEPDPLTKAELLTDAEAALLQDNIFIPIGAPVRWSLVSGGFEGFAENPWGLHPLLPMALRPI